MVIDIIDHQYEATAKDIKDLLRAKGFSNFIDMTPGPNIIGRMVNSVTCRVSQSSISLLRFWGHGWDGAQCIAGYSDCFTSRDLEKLAHSCFSNNALVEFHGCRVADGGEGASFIQS